MKRLITICLVCMLTATICHGWVVTFGENGEGDVDGTPLLAYMGICPAGPEWDATLYYILPMFTSGEMLQGDVVITEPTETIEVAAAQVPSDLLRFINVTLTEQGNIQARVYVYSDLPEEGELPPYDMADTGIPPVWVPVEDQYPPNQPIYMEEVGLEGGQNGVIYGIIGSQEYRFISDVPEPATICLLGLGGLLFGQSRKFNKK